MPEPELHRASPDHPTIYQIRIAGQLGEGWAAWFEGMAITLDDGDTLLAGPVADQAALYGILRRVRDMGLPLVSVTPVGPRAPRKDVDR
jgi:hypothetical protein